MIKVFKNLETGEMYVENDKGGLDVYARDNGAPAGVYWLVKGGVGARAKGIPFAGYVGNLWLLAEGALVDVRAAVRTHGTARLEDILRAAPATAMPGRKRAPKAGAGGQPPEPSTETKAGDVSTPGQEDAPAPPDGEA